MKIKENADEIKKIIMDYLFNYMPSEIDELSTHTQIDDVEINDVDKHIDDKKNGIIQGTGKLYVNLQFGSSSDIFNGIGCRFRSG